MDAQAAFQRGVQLHVAGDLDKAADAYREVMAADAQHADAVTNLGEVLYRQGDVAGAIALHELAVRLKPGCAIVWNNLGVALNTAGRAAEAFAAYETATARDPQNAIALSNYADALTQTGDYDGAVVRLQKALWLKPDYAEAHCNLGMAFWGMGRLDAAIGAMRVAIALNPQLAVAHKNMALVLLQCGHYAEGWREYAWRFVADNAAPRPFAHPFWEGQDLQGALLVWAEQGVGDHIMQLSMMGDLLARGLHLVWEIDARLVTLAQRAVPKGAVVHVIPRQDPPAAEGLIVAAQAPAASLGAFVRRDRAAFPMERAAYLRADPERVEEIRMCLGLGPGERLVGISWRSQNAIIGAKKSTALADWADVLATPGVRFVDLQYGDTAAEREGVALEHVEGLDLFDDLEGLAALISLCDAVVTVSNSTAHLAGALGVPTWVLVNSGGGKLSYWGNEEDTPHWYPRVRIVRQQNGETWAAPLARAAGRLREFLHIEF